MDKAARAKARQIGALECMKDSEIDSTDIPEITAWSEAAAGKFHRPINKILHDTSGRRHRGMAEERGRRSPDQNQPYPSRGHERP